jgi:hypothetical protein
VEGKELPLGERLQMRCGHVIFAGAARIFGSRSQPQPAGSHRPTTNDVQFERDSNLLPKLLDHKFQLSIKNHD